jgi:hypothetical protein
MFCECREYNKLCKLQDPTFIWESDGNIDINCLAHLPSYSPNLHAGKSMLTGEIRKGSTPSLFHQL